MRVHVHTCKWEAAYNLMPEEFKGMNDWLHRKEVVFKHTKKSYTHVYRNVCILIFTFLPFAVRR